MKYIDLRQNPAVEVELSLQDIQRLLLHETGRVLKVEGPMLYKQSEPLLKLVRWPDPVGFGVVAAQDIPKGTDLFYYGGELKDAADCCNSKEINWYLQAINHKESKCRDAKQFGDFGSLLTHAPDKLLLRDLDLSANDEKSVQTENTDCRMTTDNDLLFYASEDITADSVITHNYGEALWRLGGQSFLLFEKGTMKLINLSNVHFHGIAYIAYPSSYSNDATSLKVNDNYACPLRLTSIMFLLASATVLDPKNIEKWSQWSKIVALLLQYNLVVTLQKSVLSNDGIEVILNDIKPGGTGVELALDLNDSMKTVNEISCPIPNANMITLNRLHAFFRARPVQRYVPDPEANGCEPPPGSQIYQNKTIMPNPFKPPASSCAHSYSHSH